MPEFPPAGGAPGGANTEVQIDDAGAFFGNALFTYDKNTGIVSATRFAGGDFLFDNGWKLTEGDKIGKDKDTLYLIRADGSIAQAWPANTVSLTSATYAGPVKFTKKDAILLTEQGVCCSICNELVANIKLYSDHTVDIIYNRMVVANGPKTMKITLTCSKGHPVEVVSSG